MRTQTAELQFSFKLPSLSYIDAKWEEPTLRARSAAARAVRKAGPGAWLSRKAAAFIAWRRNSEAASELAAMSDRELIDIGISRSDLSRVFDPALNRDVSQRGSYI
jgi:uncharacterized protein YjiS (DUF1127 family)